jgi:hypothetical protein
MNSIAVDLLCRHTICDISLRNFQNNGAMKSWLRRIGIGAYLFFLFKGLAWLAIIFLGIDLLEGC